VNAKKFRGLCQNGCGKAIKRGSTKYCSLSCYRETYPPNTRRSCLNGCGKQLKENAKHFCSFRCMHAHRYTTRARTFVLNGGVYGHVPGQFLARVLRGLYGERCVECGWAERHQKTGKVPVEVEHIDGDWQNNRLENLTLLCPNCHALTLTFRALNRGHGRAHRLGGRANPLKLHWHRTGTRSSGNCSRGVQPGPEQMALLMPA
jgi:hypothetical protein